MWLTYSTTTGEQLGAWTEAEPPAEANTAAVMVPGSAMSVPAVSIWSATARGFVDVPLIDGPRLLVILTMAELQAITADTDDDVRGLVSLWLVLLAGGQAQRANSPLHQSGGTLLWAKGHLSEARRNQFLAGVPPSE